MHVVIYLPTAFYSAIASAIAEVLQVVNDIDPAKPFTYEFVSRQRQAISKSHISFPAKQRPSKRMDVLILLAGATPDIAQTVDLLDDEIRRTKSLIRQADKDGAVIATTCASSYLLAASGLLNGKRATISWWLKKEASVRFPLVRWEPSRMIIRQGRIYTTGAAFAGLELISRLLIDLGFKEQERRVRKLLVLPPSRVLQSPYEEPANPYEHEPPFVQALNQLARKDLARLDPATLARSLRLSHRTLSRRFNDELQTSPGRWIQQKRLERAKLLLETTRFSVSEICYKIGYEDAPSFSRLFSAATGLTPRTYRHQIQSPGD